MKDRTVTHLLYAHPINMDGLEVRQAFPTQNFEQLDPFLLLHHADNVIHPHMNPAHAGVGPHPHRGFSPVTFVFQGGIHHRDSRGNNSVVYAGGAQWMNAGRGIIHSERPSENIHDIGGRLEIIQLWINTPAAHKMDQPLYFPVTDDMTGKFQSEDQKVSINVIAGDVLGIQGPVPTLSPVTAATIMIQRDGRITIPVPPAYNAFLYLLKGKISISGYGLMDELHAAIFDRDGDIITFTGLEDSTVLLMSGLPLNEDVVSHGPFVMNNQTEILEAMRDFQMGKMGVLIED